MITQAKPKAKPKKIVIKAKKVSEKKLAALRAAKKKAQDKQRKLASKSRDSKQKADEAEKKAKKARKYATRERKTADTFGADRKRQAGEWNKLADSVLKDAKKFRDQANALRDKANKLRDKTAKNWDKFADKTKDKRLSGKAREAANNAREDAAKLEENAKKAEREAEKEEAIAKRRGKKRDELQKEGDEIEGKAKKAEAKAKKLEGEAGLKKAEVNQQDHEVAKAKYEASKDVQKLTIAQAENFQWTLKNPPSGDFYKKMNHKQRTEWLRNNVPKWDNLSQKKKEKALSMIGFSQTTHRLKSANQSFDGFTKKHNIKIDPKKPAKGIQKWVESRQERIKHLNKRIFEVEDTLWINKETRKKIKGLKADLAREQRTFKEAIEEFGKIRDAKVKEGTSFAKQLWSLDKKARGKEIDSRVKRYANYKAQLELTKEQAKVRHSAFIKRMSDVRRVLTDAKRRHDGDAIKKYQQALDRLDKAHASLQTQDKTNIKTLERIIKSHRSSITTDSAYMVWEKSGPINN